MRRHRKCHRVGSFTRHQTCAVSGTCVPRVSPKSCRTRDHGEGKQRVLGAGAPSPVGCSTVQLQGRSPTWPEIASSRRRGTTCVLAATRRRCPRARAGGVGCLCVLSRWLLAPAEHLAGTALVVWPRTRIDDGEEKRPRKPKAGAMTTLRVTTRWAESGLRCAPSLKDTAKRIPQRLCPAVSSRSDSYTKTLLYTS